jgi:hypothetical protein
VHALLSAFKATAERFLLFLRNVRRIEVNASGARILISQGLL